MDSRHRLAIPRSLVFVALSLGMGLWACSSASTSEPIASTGSAVSTTPYVALRFAQAEQTSATPPTQNLTASGLIEVSNDAYEKQVVVHYQGPNGWVDSSATYAGPATTAGHELWSFTTGAYPYLPEYSGEAIYFAVEYTVDGTTTWDNNGGANYVVGIQGGDGVAEVPVALGQDKLKVADYSLTPSAMGVTLGGHVVLKNLAYQKVVTVVESSDDWATQVSVPASYEASDAGGLETWSFSKALPAGVTSAQFAVIYEVDGATYSDNNLGANYSANL
jgi:hypothetical protein